MLAVHWRMKTHGHVDLTNCHPYDVVEGKVAMMHNGILHTGNSADPTKSDTWHFIKDFLAEPAAKFPGLVHEKTFLEMCGEYIDSNRFVFMDDEGRLSIVNRDQGIEHRRRQPGDLEHDRPRRLIRAQEVRDFLERQRCQARADERVHLACGTPTNRCGCLDQCHGARAELRAATTRRDLVGRDRTHAAQLAGTELRLNDFFEE